MVMRTVALLLLASVLPVGVRGHVSLPDARATMRMHRKSTQALRAEPNCMPNLWDIIDNNKNLMVVREQTQVKRGAHGITRTQEEQLGRSSFSGNYTLIRDIYAQGETNYTTIVPQDMYGGRRVFRACLTSGSSRSAYGLVPGGMRTFNGFWGNFLWNGTLHDDVVYSQHVCNDP